MAARDLGHGWYRLRVFVMLKYQHKTQYTSIID